MVRRIALLACFVSATLLAQDMTWRAQASGTTENLSGVSFGTATTGLAVGSNGTILRTSDGGLHWFKVTISQLDPARCCSDVSFFNASTAWLAGEGTVLRTTSGGSGWSGFSYTTHTRRAVSSSAADTGFFVGTHSSGGRYVARHTFVGNSNTLNSWATGSENLYDVDFVSSEEGWIAASSGRIIHVTEGTAQSPTFTNQTTGTTLTLRSIDMVDRNNGWAAGDDGTILHTTNGGSTWTAQHSGTVNDLRSVSFKNLNEGFAVGTGGLILATTDGGTTWRSESSGVSIELTAVFHGPITVAAGANGTILQRTSASCTFSLTATSSSLVSSSGGTGGFSVETLPGCTWTAVSQVPWVTITAGSGGNGIGQVSYSVAANAGAAAREGTIAAAGHTYTVSQLGTSGTCPFTLSSATTTFGKSGGVGTVNVATLAGCSWLLQSNASWLTFEGSGSGFGPGPKTFRVAANATGADRNGAITVFFRDDVQGVTITQTATGGPARRRAARR
jgi:photosystem II stability/assembly factor-like uncharacterized protein